MSKAYELLSFLVTSSDEGSAPAKATYSYAGPTRQQVLVRTQISERMRKLFSHSSLRGNYARGGGGGANSVVCLFQRPPGAKGSFSRIVRFPQTRRRRWTPEPLGWTAWLAINISF